MSVAKVVEISATSAKSFEHAINRGLERANNTIDHIEGAWVKCQEWQSRQIPRQSKADIRPSIEQRTPYCTREKLHTGPDGSPSGQFLIRIARNAKTQSRRDMK
jgi:flavin-binding protein dodecin